MPSEVRKKTSLSQISVLFLDCADEGHYCLLLLYKIIRCEAPAGKYSVSLWAINITGAFSLIGPMELKKAITTVALCSVGGWGFKTELCGRRVE